MSEPKTNPNTEPETDPMNGPAVVCDMTNAPDSAAQRLDEYARLFDRAFISRERTADAVQWRLRAAPGVEAWARDLAAREKACCAFMSITVTVIDEQVLWDATTIDYPVARSVLDLYYDLPETRWTDVDAVNERFVEASGVPGVIVEAAMTRPATLDEIHGR
jgi:hypothetical protein